MTKAQGDDLLRMYLLRQPSDQEIAGFNNIRNVFGGFMVFR